MKILRVLETFQTELKYLEHYITDELKKKKIQTDFLTSKHVPKILEPFLHETNFKEGIYKYNDSKVIRLKSISIFNKQIIIEFKKLFKLVQYDYDIIHIHGIGNFVTFSILSSMFFMKKKPIIIVNDHSNPELKSIGIYAKIFYTINKFLFYLTKRNINKIVTVNQASFNFLKNHYGLENTDIEIIPLGYDANQFRNISAKKNTDKNILVLGFAGKINEAKHIELLIDAISDLENIKCKIVGINEENISEYQQSLLCYQDNRITFYPLIKDPKKLSDFYNEIDVAVFPGSISITTIEATGCGTPIILYKSLEGLEDRVNQGRGILFESKKELKEAIQKFIEEKNNLAINHAKIAKNTEQYSWKNISKEYLKLYQNILENK